MKLHTYSNTNIKCAACEAKIQGAFNQDSRITSFKVDLVDENRPLVVETADDMTTGEVSALIHQAGYDAKPEKKGLFSKIFKK